MRFSSVFALGAALLTLQIPATVADCCSCPNDGKCPDRTQCVPFQSCCGKGPCNVFCCNCDDGCRSYSAGLLRTNLRLAQQQEAMACSENLAKYDVNQDGNISFLEWALRGPEAGSVPVAELAERWLKFDVEGKGYLTLTEAMHRKAK